MVKKNILTHSGIILLAAGLSIILLGVAADSLHLGSHGFGLNQLSVVVVGGIVTLAGLRKLFLPSQTKLDGILLITYFFGLLFMGIKPKDYALNKHFLSLAPVYLDIDFILNLFGFLPLGFLGMSYLVDNNRLQKISAAAVSVLVGTSISLSLEMIQYVIPGRGSSLSDWILNSIGTFLGVCFYLLISK